jgi:hypothetical protein
MTLAELQEQIKTSKNEYIDLKVNAVVKKIKYNDLIRELNWQFVEVIREEFVYHYYIAPHIFLDFPYDNFGYVKIANSIMSYKFFEFLDGLTEFEEYVVKL